MDITRRKALSLGASLTLPALLAPRIARAQAAKDVAIKPMKITVGHVPSFAYAGFYVGLERGYFKARGLDVNLTITRGGDTAFQVAGGTLHFAGGSPDTAFFNGVDRGLPLMGLASLAVNGPDKSSNHMIVRNDLLESGKVTKSSQLKGLKVANLVEGGIMEYVLALYLKAAGLGLSDVSVVSPMRFPQMVDALATKNVDAAVVAEPFATMAAQKKIATVIDDKADVNEQILWIQANPDFAQKNADVVTNFLIGFMLAARDIKRETLSGEKIVPIVEKYTKLPREIIDRAAPPVVPSNGELYVDSIMAQQRYHLNRGKMTYSKLIPIERFTDRSYAARAKAFLDS